MLIVTQYREKISFKEFLFKTQENNLYLKVAIILSLLQLIIYKYIYPFPNFLNGDTWIYILNAQSNAKIAIHPIGYAMFLRIFSAITISDTALVIFQFLLLYLASLFLNFTLYYFLAPSRNIKIFLLISVFINPIFPLIANTISSDNVCLSLGIIWFGLLLWIIYKPSTSIFFWHAAVLFLAFTMRFNAIFFPIISLIAFCLSKSSYRQKILGFVCCILFVGSFVMYNRERYFQLCGIRQFAPFSGWQMANNALYAYRYVTPSKHIKVPVKFEKLDSLVCNYFINAPLDKENTLESKRALDGYLWEQKSPLWIYFHKYVDKNYTGEYKYWAVIAPFYYEYGRWIIIHYPKEFIQNVVFPHIQWWLIPPMYSLEHYNGGLINIISKDIIKWFEYDSGLITTRLLDRNKLDGVYGIYPYWTLIINISFWILVFSFIVQKGRLRNPILFKSIILVSFFWVINFSFNVFASQIELRYLLFPVHIMTVFSILIFGSLVKTST